MVTGIAALKLAIKTLGSQAAAAEAIGIRQQSVSELVNNGKRVPAEWCKPLQIATAQAGEKITAHQLRPDIFEAPAKRLRRPIRVGRTAEARA